MVARAESDPAVLFHFGHVARRLHGNVRTFEEENFFSQE
jgi:hypothetical protein